MNKLIVVFLFSFAGTVYAQTPTPKPPSVAEIVIQQEHTWVDGVKAGDAAKVGAVLAEDWVTIGTDGAKITKQKYVADITSGAEHIDSFEFGPVDVKVIGSVAVVQGSDNEKSSFRGKDTSGKWAWMDVYALRGNKWVAVRSQMALVQPKATAFVPPSAELVTKGDFHLRRGDYDDAIHSYQEALKAEPGNTSIRRKLDSAVQECKKQDGVLKSGDKCGEP